MSYYVYIVIPLTAIIVASLNRDTYDVCVCVFVRFAHETRTLYGMAVIESALHTRATSIIA